VAMEVIFGSTALRRAYERPAEAQRKWGEQVGRAYVRRVNLLYGLNNARELHAFPETDFHPLTGDRKGQHAITLAGRWRLIVTIVDSKWTVVRLEEVSNHYGD
jgi:plasmid maintenance system killer protein